MTFARGGGQEEGGTLAAKLPHDTTAVTDAARAASPPTTEASADQPAERAANDLEYVLTKKIWEEPGLQAAAEKDPVAVLASIGVTVPSDVKVKIIVQRRDTLYFTIPPAKKAGAASTPAPTNQMDLWSSGD